MKKKINIVSIDTPPIQKNPYILFIADTLSNDYDISYWGLDKAKNYRNITMFYINNICLKIFRRVMRPMAFLFLMISNSKTVKCYSFFEIKSVAIYISDIIGSNIFLFFSLLYNSKHKDAFIVINAGGLLALSWLKKIRNIRYCYCIYECYPFQSFVKSRLFSSWRCFFENNGIQKSDFLMDAGENKISLFMSKIYKIKKKEIKNILITPKPNFRFSREKTEYPVKFYYHGGYMANRGLEELVCSMKNIDARKGNLYLRGIGDLKKELEEIVSEYNINDRVIFLDPVETELLSDVAADFDVGLTMLKMNCFNHKFGVGFKTFENMNAGLALIAGASYNLKPMFDKYKVGILYTDATIDELTRVMNYCIENIEWLDDCKRVSRYCMENVMGRSFQEIKLIKAIETLFMVA